METDTNASEGRGADSTPTYSCPITLAQKSSRLKIIHSEKLKWWKWLCSAVHLISTFKKKNEVMAKGIGNDNEAGGNMAQAWDFSTVKDDNTVRIPQCIKQKQHLNMEHKEERQGRGKKRRSLKKLKLCVL